MQKKLKGKIITVVGPSGVGKDTLIQNAKKILPFYFPKRIITRLENEKENEDFISVSLEEFRDKKKRGEFSLFWEAHEIHYGIPISIDQKINEGNIVIFNGSREAIPLIKRKFSELKIIHIHADKKVLEKRLLLRGRESLDQIKLRLNRQNFQINKDAIVINNNKLISLVLKEFIEKINLISRSD